MARPLAWGPHSPHAPRPQLAPPLAPHPCGAANVQFRPGSPAGFGVVQYVGASGSLPSTTPPQPGTLAPWPLSAQVGAACACCQSMLCRPAAADSVAAGGSPPPLAQAQFVMSAALLEAGVKGDKVPDGYQQATQKVRGIGSRLLVLRRAAAVQAAPASAGERRRAYAPFPTLSCCRSRPPICPCESTSPSRSCRRQGSCAGR